MRKRVYTLYRVSTVGQVDKNDIPMQKTRCREFAGQMGWEIIKEVSEKGVSGFKVSAKDRDAIIEIQEAAALGKFDILLVFMFDRIGRREDETPFVVEWFIRNGVEVWSAEEGQQKIDNHVDKLMNYIRYWQASGESIKTSVRTKTRLEQMAREGIYTGGSVPYGYKLVKNGRVNKKGHECFDLAIDEEEAAIVRLIFEKYVYEGLGGHRLVRYLLDRGIRTRSGDNFPNTSLTRMLKNIAYMGILKSGDARSDIFEHLQIIPPEMFERAQEIMAKRAKKLKHSDVPLNTKGKAMLSGLVYCGHCKNILTLTTSGTRYRTEDGKRVPQVRYMCHYRTRHPQSCDGQSGYSVTKLDAIVEKVILHLFKQVKIASKNELATAELDRHQRLTQITMSQVEQTLQEKEKDLLLYKSEVAKSLRDESKWDTDLLGEMITETKEQIAAEEAELSKLRAELESYSEKIEGLEKKYENVTSWADLFEMSSMEAKKMIVHQLIKQVRVSRDYKIEIDLNIDYQQFSGLLNTADADDLDQDKKRVSA